MTTFAREATAALLLVCGCAAGGEAAQRDADALRSEVRDLRRQNEELQRKVEALSTHVDALAAKAGRPAARDDAAGAAGAAAPLVPRDLAVVRVQPEPASAPRARVAPPVPTAVAIAEPDPGRLDALSGRGGRELAAEAEDELRRARERREGAARAHALEDFVTRYPRHPSADNALVEAASAYASVRDEDAACALARRATVDYPAGDAMSDALERLAWCEAQRGASIAERRLLERLVQEFPRTPAAERAGERLATISGRSGETSPSVPARSGP